MTAPSPTPTEIAKPCPFCHAAAEMVQQGCYGCSDRECPAYLANIVLRLWNRRPAPETQAPVESAPALAPFEKLADLQGIITQIHRLRTDGFVNHGSYADKELEAIETRLSAVVEEVRGK